MNLGIISFMKICFVLPRYVRHPIGGYKIVYEYANRLVANSRNEVYILYLNDNTLSKKPLPLFLKKILINQFTNLGPNWFNLDKRVKNISMTQKKWRRKLGKVDKVIATAATTVGPTAKLFPNNSKFYLIQDFENWYMSDLDLYKTYNYPGFTNITISKWLENVVLMHSSNPTFYLQNPLDVENYKINVPINHRKHHTVALLYHEAPYKGTKYALEAIHVLKKIYPDLTVIMFGAYPRPQDLPNWIDYFQNASKKKTIEIYNSVCIFLNASIKEGFGLTGLEAMACGAALVSTDYLGVKEYAVDKKNALLSSIKNSSELVKNVSFLFENDEERIRLAINGNKTAQYFSWNVAYKKFLSILSS